MNLAALIARTRTDSGDIKRAISGGDDTLWSNDDIRDWLNDAESEAAVRRRLLHESENPDVCSIDVGEGVATYSLHWSLYEITHARFIPGNGEPQKIDLKSTEALDAIMPDWRDREGMPQFAVQKDTTIRLVPTPSIGGELRLEGYRLPLTPMKDEKDEPEIHKAHHIHLVQWVLFRGFSIPDSDLFDTARAAQAEREFTRYFGIAPDADLRRETREDTPHHVEAFWA